MKKLQHFFLAVVCSLFTVISFAQSRMISGKVVDDSGQPIVAATVRVTGTQVGTVTDLDGAFSIEVPSDAQNFTVSYVGMESKEVPIANNMTISLSDDSNILDDVVIIGYNTQSRKDLTGSVSSVDMSKLEDIPLPNAITALQGRAPGVTVTKNTGTPGGGVDVRIRGSTSINASNQPLYVVDGIPIINDNTDFTQEGVGNAQLSVLSDLNPDDIASMEVLKDAASASIYGSRAANGVVLITTKRGKAGKTQIDITTSYATQRPIKKIPVVDGPTYIDYLTLLYGGNIIGTEANTNWQDEIFRDSPVKNFNVNFRGGNDKTRFYSSLGVEDNKGIIVGSQFKRYSGLLNLDQILSKKFDFGMRLGYTYSITDQIQNDNNIYGALSTAILLPPIVPIYKEDGSYGSAFGLENPVAATREYANQVDRNRLLGRAFIQYNITDYLNFRTSLGAEVMDLKEDIYEPRVLQSSATGRAVLGQYHNTRTINENILTFDKKFGEHSLMVLGGFSFQEDKRKNTYAEAVDFPTDSFRGISSGAQPLTTNGGFSGDNLQSYYGNMTYNYLGKYFLTGTFRADGSSKFVNNRWGYFPGISAGWKISEEDFMANSKIDELKLRGSWGKTGNNSIGNFDSRQLYGGGSNYLDAPGTYPSQIGNPDLKWETTTQFGIGLDYAILDNRLIGSFDYYKKNTNDLLLNRPIPTTSGFLSVLQNIGEVENTGFEFSLLTKNIDKKDFTWSTSFDAGFNKNRIKKLVDGIPIDRGFASIIAEGQPLGSFYGRVTDGIFQNQAEIDAHATQRNAKPGDIRFKDISGGPGPDGILGTADDLPPDGIINDNDRTYIGKGIPDWTGGMTNDFSYKGFDASLFFQFASGFEIWNNNLAFAEGLNSVFAPTKRAWENRWQEEGDKTNIPRAVLGDPNGNRLESDRFAEKGDYIRLKTLSIGYTMPAQFTNRIGVNKLRFYVAGYNIWTHTDYSWFDPEVSTFDSSDLSGAPSTDFLTFPQPKAYNFGLNLGF